MTEAERTSWSAPQRSNGRTTVALFRYFLSTFAHSQRYLAPVLLYIALIAVLTGSDSGPLVPVYATCSVAMFVCSAWLTVALLNTEDPVGRGILVVAAGASRAVLGAAVWLAFVAVVVMAGVGLGYPLMSGSHASDGADLVVGIVALLTCGVMGMAVGLACSRTVIGRPGFSLVAATIMVGLWLLVPWLPPIHPLLRLLESGEPARQLLLRAIGWAAIGVAFLAASAAGTQYVTVRRS
jgi:hypothetical protein